MIAFFRSLDPIKFIALLLLLLALRLPLILMGIPLIEPELYWLLIGEKMKHGFSMYIDVYDTLAPFSAGTYYLLSFFGKSQVVLQVASLVVVLIQASIFNYTANLHNIFKEKTLIPALVYLTVSCLFFDFYTLSPAMLATTLILLGFQLLLAQIRDAPTNESIFYTGLLVGFASLFYLPAALFLVVIVLALLLYSSSTLKFITLLLVGALFPLLCVGVYYYLIDGPYDFINNFFTTFFYIKAVYYMPFNQLLLVLALPALLTLCSIVVVSASKLTNFQYTVMRIMLAWLLFAGSTFLATDQVAPFQLYLMVPPISYFGVQFFMLIRRQALADLLFLVFLLLVVAFNYGSYHLGFNTTNGISYKTINTNIKRDIQGKHLLVIGDDAGLYVGNSMATPYINWQLTEGQLGVLNNYYNMSAIHRNFKNDMPDVIVDEKGIAPQLFYHLPLLEKEYRLERENVYVRKP